MNAFVNKELDQKYKVVNPYSTKEYFVSVIQQEFTMLYTLYLRLFDII